MKPTARSGDSAGRRIGITGGIGCGKSEVAAIIERAGYPVLSSDRVAKNLMESDAAIRRAIAKEFGSQTYNESGNLNRASLAHQVFSDPNKLDLLESIVHPAVIQHIDGEIEALHAKGSPIVFVESALIYEAGIDDSYSLIIAVVSNPLLVKQRLVHRGLSEAEIDRRIARQIPNHDKASWSDFTITNDGSLDDLERNTRFVIMMIETLCRES